MPTYFIPADAHEGCTWVPQQQRLYFTTTKKKDPHRVGICYLDFSAYDLARDARWGERLDESVTSLQAREWLHDANMANSMCLSEDGNGLLVCEQGDMDRPARLTRLALDTRERSVLFDGYRGKPLNSLNKVIRSQQGHLIVSDPDYGFRQHFRPPPVLEPSLYVLPRDGEPFAFDCGLEMPHGLALSPDERTLFVTDTSNDGAHDDGVTLKRRRAVYLFDFDPSTGKITNDPRYAFAVDKGVPDGCLTDGDVFLVGGGDGIYVSDLIGNYRGKIKLDRTAVNLAVVHKHLFVTADEGVYIILDWRQQLS
ncbi:hypothetical protein LEM8419_01054 [Neolewinella maritima]|uniref:SMP-30/Gluconolactonase/LRE-like region domain-containing protein n=1 Tax=Neolewinella maritima TaxID=1383882 RepID=A0ABN8F0C3_9BACT|nr:SMP-30/gluconolactonase/LRE family protein [Neolewinella maritima]CAH0999754.1 hypothetical protein LEM8419_01054 [Neolewinella maritima]